MAVTSISTTSSFVSTWLQLKGEKYVGTRTTHMWTWNAHFDEFLERMDTDEYHLTKLIISPFAWDADSLYKSAIPPACDPNKTSCLLLVSSTGSNLSMFIDFLPNVVVVERFQSRTVSKNARKERIRFCRSPV